MKVNKLHRYAQKLVGMKEDENAPCYSPAQLHPDGVGGRAQEIYFQRLGEAAFHFLNSRKKFKTRGKLNAK